MSTEIQNNTQMTNMIAQKAMTMPMASTLQKAELMQPTKSLSMQQKSEFVKVARGFESIFVNMMFKGMKEAMLNKDKKDGDLSFGADTLSGYTDMMFSDEVAKQGTGMGIADKVYNFLTQGDKLSNYIKEFNPNFKNAKHDLQGKINQSHGSQPQISQNLTGGKLNEKISNYTSIIDEASKAYNVPQNLIKAVIYTESAAKENAVSPAGAKGLMQLMDGTANDLGVSDSFDPYQNIMGGTKYLSSMLNQYGGDLNSALAAYNAGPANVDKYNGVPPFAETKQYINRVKQIQNLLNNND